MVVLKTIDAHAGGEPLRLIVEGFPAPRGKSMAAKREWALRHADHIRRILMLEPRGHADMCGAVLTEPTSPGSHAGLLFMDNDGFGTMSGHGVIAVATIALERDLIVPAGNGRTLTFDTPAGTVRATAHWAQEATGRPRAEASAKTPAFAKAEAGDGIGRAEAGMAGRAGRQGEGEDAETSSEVTEVGGGRKVGHVTFVNVPSFVLKGGIDVVVGHRRVRADIAYGGVFYAIVDGESVGVPLDAAHVPELRRIGTAIKSAIDAMGTVAHPIEPGLTGIYGTIFTGPPHHASADLRNVTVFANGALDRSACGTGTAAVMTVIDAMGLLDDQRAFVHESIIGTTFSGRVVGRTMVGDYPAIVPEIEGSAWITGEHTFSVDASDPLHDGFGL